MRKIIYAFLVFLSMTGTIFAAKQTVNNGETLGQARTKINDNFTETYNLFGNFAGTSIGDIVRFVDAGVCSDTQYTTEATCETATETWTPALGLPMTYDVKDLLDSDNLLGGGGTWGSITGTLSDQTDLQSALDAITAGGINITTATPTTAGSANLNDTTHVLSVASSTGLTAFTGSFTAWDTTPEAFEFTAVNDAALSTVYTDCDQITGINWPTAITATGGTAAVCTSATYATDCGTFGTAPGNVANDGYVCARHTSSASNSTATNTEVTIGGVSDTFTSTTASPVDTYSDIILFNRMESSTLSSGDCYGADSTMTAVGTVALNTSAVKLGANGAQIGTGAGYYILNVTSNDIINPAEGRVGVWHYYVDTPTSNQEIFRAYSSVNLSGERIDLQTEGSGLQFKFVTANIDPGALSSVGLTFVTGTWYYIEIAWNVSTGYREIFVNNVSYGTSTTSLVTSTAINSMLFGSYASGSGVRYADQYIVSNDSTRSLYALRNTENCPK